MPHIHEKYDYTVSAVVVHNQKALLIKHKYLPLWTPPAGHVELDQTPIEALYAELIEEAGISREDVTVHAPYKDNLVFQSESNNYSLPVPFDINVHEINEGHSHIDSAYIVESKTDRVKPQESNNESKIWKWMTLEEVKNFAEISPNIRDRAIYAINYLSKSVE